MPDTPQDEPDVLRPIVPRDHVDIRTAADDTWYVRYVPDGTIVATGLRSHSEAFLMAEQDISRYLASAYPVLHRQAQDMAATLTQIKIALGEVATYQGIDVSPVAMLVSELVRDHEALEQRIENALVVLASNDSITRDGHIRIIGLLRGASPIPDTIEGLEP